MDTADPVPPESIDIPLVDSFDDDDATPPEGTAALHAGDELEAQLARFEARRAEAAERRAAAIAKEEAREWPIGKACPRAGWKPHKVGIELIAELGLMRVTSDVCLLKAISPGEAYNDTILTADTEAHARNAIAYTVYATGDRVPSRADGGFDAGDEVIHLSASADSVDPRNPNCPWYFVEYEDIAGGWTPGDIDRLLANTDGLDIDALQQHVTTQRERHQGTAGGEPAFWAELAGALGATSLLDRTRRLAVVRVRWPEHSRIAEVVEASLRNIVGGRGRYDGLWAEQVALCRRAERETANSKPIWSEPLATLECYAPGSLVLLRLEGEDAVHCATVVDHDARMLGAVPGAARTSQSPNPIPFPSGGDRPALDPRPYPPFTEAYRALIEGWREEPEPEPTTV